MAVVGELDEAYERLHRSGPEWGGNLTNHGPMAAEVMARHDRAEQIPQWLDAYVTRLDELPSAGDPIDAENWRAALGERVGDWAAFMGRQVTERPWREILATWWTRLLPGIAAGATHGVIRTGHAVRTLLGGDESPPALAELAHGLAFWAARSQTVPGVVAPSGSRAPGVALDAIPRLSDQDGPIRGRLARLGEVPGWSGALAALRPVAEPDDVPDLLAEVVAAATVRYLTHGQASPVLLVHTASAPNAVLHTLPALPREFWPQSLTAAWAASAAITAMYAPAVAISETPPAPSPPANDDPAADVLDRAFAHGDEHVMKFTDTAVEVYNRTGDHAALAAAGYSATLLPPASF